MIFLARAAVAAGLCCMGAGAYAQTVRPPAGPSERARPEFEPVGGRVGSFIIHPRVDASLTYNDNVLAAPSDGTSDFIFVAAPGIRVDSLWSRHKFTFDADVSQELYAKLGSENALQGAARADGVLDLTRRSSLRLNASAEFLAEERYSITSLNLAGERTRFSRVILGASYSQDLDPLYLTADAQMLRLDFSDVEARTGATIDQDFRDAVLLSGSLRGSYRISPGISAVGRIAVDRFDYTNTDVASGQLDRDSTGVKLEAGVGFELSRLLFGDVRVGLLNRQSEDERLPDVNGLSLAVGLTWTPTGLTTVRVDADRSIEESGNLLTSGNLRTQVAARVEHELRRYLILGAAVRFAIIDPIGPIAKAREYDGELTATYLISRRLRASARIRHFTRQSDSPFFSDFDQNRVTVAVRWTL